MVIFETERLLVRQYEKEDADNFFLLNGDEEVVRYIRPSKTREECDVFLESVMADYQTAPLFGRWAVEEKSSKIFAGSFALIPVEGKEQMQLGYALLPGHWGKGYATELSRAGLEYVFSKTAIDPVYAYTETQNIASQKVLLKVGFALDGTSKEGEKELVGFVLPRISFFNKKAEK